MPTPFALAFSFVALRSWRPIAFAAAAVLCALTVATNFYGAVALAIFFPVAVWSIWVTQCQAAVWLRAGGIAVLAWLLSAFWLTPSYLQVTTINLGLVNASGDSRVANNRSARGGFVFQEFRGGGASSGLIAPGRYSPWEPPVY